jgi:hypothetical protein
MTLEQESRRGEQARRLTEDPLLQEAFATIEAALHDTWSTTGDDATGERERIWLMLKLLRRVRACLSKVLETGRLADTQLAEMANGRPLCTAIRD